MIYQLPSKPPFHHRAELSKPKHPPLNQNSEIVEGSPQGSFFSSWERGTWGMAQRAGVHYRFEHNEGERGHFQKSVLIRTWLPRGWVWLRNILSSYSSLSVSLMYQQEQQQLYNFFSSASATDAFVHSSPSSSSSSSFSFPSSSPLPLLFLLLLLLFYQTKPLYSRLPSTFCCHLPFLGPHSTWDFSSPLHPSRFSNTQSFRPSLVLLSLHPCHPCITKSYLPWIQWTQWHPLD